MDAMSKVSTVSGMAAGTLKGDHLSIYADLEPQGGAARRGGHGVFSIPTPIFNSILSLWNQ